MPDPLQVLDRNSPACVLPSQPTGSVSNDLHHAVMSDWNRMPGTPVGTVSVGAHDREPDTELAAVVEEAVEEFDMVGVV